MQYTGMHCNACRLWPESFGWQMCLAAAHKAIFPVLSFTCRRRMYTCLHPGYALWVCFDRHFCTFDFYLQTQNCPSRYHREPLTTPFWNTRHGWSDPGARQIEQPVPLEYCCSNHKKTVLILSVMYLLCCLSVRNLCVAGNRPLLHDSSLQLSWYKKLQKTHFWSLRMANSGCLCRYIHIYYLNIQQVKMYRQVHDFNKANSLGGVRPPFSCTVCHWEKPDWTCFALSGINGKAPGLWLTR